MKAVLKILVLGISFLLLNSCEKDDSISKPKSTSINKIMVLGASRVAGNRPDYESFRYELWKDLTENNWKFDFIGTQLDGASYPLFNNLNFDTNHEGRAGWTSGEILNVINNSLNQTGPPDIVLFSSPAGNDGLQNLPYNQAISNIEAIIDALQNANPNTTIIIEQLAPARAAIMTPELTNYFNQLIQDVLTIASEKSTSSSQVIAADMFTDFTDSLLADDVHYNEAGANFIASRYYTILQNILEQ
jgi:lysophospholipase L1-like esterase